MSFGATIGEAVAMIRADSSQLDPGLKDAQKKFGRFGAQVQKSLGRAFKRVTQVVTGGLAAGFALAGRESLQFADQMQRLGSQARFNSAQTNMFAGSLTKLSGESGQSRDAIAAAVDEMVNLEGGTAATIKNAETLTKAMQATGGSGRDMANVMFTLGSNMKITQDQMQGVLGGIDRIGAEASIPFSQLATSYVEVAAAASKFGDTGPKAVFATVAAMQAMRKEIPTADEIKTSFTGMAADLIKKSKKIKKEFGVTVLDQDGQLRSLQTILGELKQSGITTGQIYQTFGKRAAKGLSALVDNYGTYQSLAAKGIEGQSEDFLGVRATERANSGIGKFNKAVNQAKLAFASAFTPQRIEAVAEALGQGAKAIGFMADNIKPLLALGAVFKTGSMLLGAADAAKLTGAMASGSKAAGAAAGSAFGLKAKAGLLAASAVAGVAIGTKIAEAAGFYDDPTANMTDRQKLEAKRDSFPIFQRDSKSNPYQRRLDELDDKERKKNLSDLAKGIAFTGADVRRAKAEIRVNRPGTSDRAFGDTSDLDGVTAGDINRMTRYLAEIASSMKRVDRNTEGAGTVLRDPPSNTPGWGVLNP